MQSGNLGLLPLALVLIATLCSNAAAQGNLIVPPPPDVGAVPADATRTATGLAFRVLRKGTGEVRPKATDRVTVRYVAWTSDGKTLDNSAKYRAGKPIDFPVSQVIRGLSEGLQLMVAGEKRRLWIPEKLAYGKRRPGMVVYDLDLIGVLAGRPERKAAPGRDEAFARALDMILNAAVYGFEEFKGEEIRKKGQSFRWQSTVQLPGTPHAVILRDLSPGGGEDPQRKGEQLWNYVWRANIAIEKDHAAAMASYRDFVKRVNNCKLACTKNTYRSSAKTGENSEFTSWRLLELNEGYDRRVGAAMAMVEVSRWPGNAADTVSRVDFQVWTQGRDNPPITWKSVGWEKVGVKLQVPQEWGTERSQPQQGGRVRFVSAGRDTFVQVKLFSFEEEQKLAEAAKAFRRRFLAPTYKIDLSRHSPGTGTVGNADGEGLTAAVLRAQGEMEGKRVLVINASFEHGGHHHELVMTTLQSAVLANRYVLKAIMDHIELLP